MELINPRYFTSTQGVDIWDDVAEYLNDKYRCYKANVHLSGDGASWIRSGAFILPKIDYTLDKFHLHRALMTLSRGNMKLLRQLTDCAYNGDGDRFRKLCRENNITGKDTHRLRLYITSNIEFISDTSRCSAESHVSHVLSARMSSRPMGWSVAGAERMAKLRAYLFNKGDFRLLFEGYYKRKLIQTSITRQNNVPTAPSNIPSCAAANGFIPGIEKVTAHFAGAIKELLKIK